jgi:diguanylate cyclase (GGDEF)-like protein
MAEDKLDFLELHWLLDTLQSVDVGVVVLDRQYRVTVWNSFIASHSGVSAATAVGRRLFDLFPEVPERWFRQKAEPVYLLRARAFTNWEQRPYLFRFRDQRPITGTSEFMYQNVTMIPLVSPDSTVQHMALIVYDVTDAAVNRIELGKANVELERLSRTDRLTELNNRGYWEECLAAEFRRVRRTGRPCSLVMFDIDHFKRVNDTYGHPAGDEVIRQTARILRETMRKTDVAGRYGGEEFTVLLIDTQGPDALVFAERLRSAVAETPVAFEGQTIAYTISLGVAGLDQALGSHGQWLEAADAALYVSKRGGRNRVTLHGPPGPARDGG